MMRFAFGRNAGCSYHCYHEQILHPTALILTWQNLPRSKLCCCSELKHCRIALALSFERPTWQSWFGGFCHKQCTCSMICTGRIWYEAMNSKSVHASEQILAQDLVMWLWRLHPLNYTYITRRTSDIFCDSYTVDLKSMTCKKKQ